MNNNYRQLLMQPKYAFTALVFTILLGNAALTTAETPIRIDCEFPGGNIILERIENSTVFVRPDLRDTKGNWFYWSFRVRGAEGGELTFRFNRNVIGVRGPAVSCNEGKSWRWLYGKALKSPQNSFTYKFGPDEKSVRFCVAMPYQKGNLGALFKKYSARNDFVVEHHATSRKGRDVPRFRFGSIRSEPKYRILLTCRHHACEMMASWTLEGLVDTVMANDSRGEWLRENVEFLCIPMVDLDGVEDGDQGKNRKPHDHNRDYYPEPPIYPEVAAIKQFVPKWSKGRLRMALDLHCPFLYGKSNVKGGNQSLFFVGNPKEDSFEKLMSFSKILEEVLKGPIKYDSRRNLPWGESWNTLKEPRMFARWADNLPGISIATVLEIPYADISGEPVTIESARALGADLAAAIERWLKRQAENQ
ncbi:MAG: hypothetical protein JXM70_25760 [Pirellulales bacterium]|nr:hypothetical protein [Pirellulales bacterium]